MIRNALFYVALVVSTGFFSIVAVVAVRIGGGHAAIDWIDRNWARSLLAVGGVRLTVHGLEHLDPSGSQIIVANHQSYFDVWALMAALPVSLRFIAKRELARIPLLGRAMEAGGHVFIDRAHARRARETLRIAGRRMRHEGLTLVVFPEGTRSRDGKLGRFRRGSFALALETGVPLVPVALEGGYRVYPPGSRRVKPGRMTLRLAPPISLAGVDRPDRGELMRETRAAIEAMLGGAGEGGRRPEQG
ncbi:lysophospholipid acyltransferase family protein [Candidatus Palauibacter sp.]|uniref:lysophospholipid acyltransferase family protein n=1 Tax=Candidatus Palauibacter sp. TaxID=3101350 RepID=UPI003B011067